MQNDCRNLVPPPIRQSKWPQKWHQVISALFGVERHKLTSREALQRPVRLGLYGDDTGTILGELHNPIHATTTRCESFSCCGNDDRPNFSVGHLDAAL